MGNPGGGIAVFDSVARGGPSEDRDCQPNFVTRNENGAGDVPLETSCRWYTEIGWKLGEEARIYIVNSVTSPEIGSQSTNFRHIPYANGHGLHGTEMGEDLRGPRFCYVTISVPNIKPINSQHLSRSVGQSEKSPGFFLLSVRDRWKFFVYLVCQCSNMLDFPIFLPPAIRVIAASAVSRIGERYPRSPRG